MAALSVDSPGVSSRAIHANQSRPSESMLPSD
jgi:hypothetical protein